MILGAMYAHLTFERYTYTLSTVLMLQVFTLLNIVSHFMI